VNRNQVTLGNTAINVEVVDTDASRERGLSGHAQLAEGEGMLFVFETDDQWGIWMKDMKFPIDIVWAAADGTIVTILRNVAPETYPMVFTPASPARYVLELPAGYVDAHQVAEGTKIVI
jgi:uncharacterized membrane protein (UPF0127 family)